MNLHLGHCAEARGQNSPRNSCAFHKGHDYGDTLGGRGVGKRFRDRDISLKLQALFKHSDHHSQVVTNNGDLHTEGRATS
jgi:hypothetical protein